MSDPWTTYKLLKPESDKLKALFKYRNAITPLPSASGKLFYVGRKWEVYSISLNDFTISHITPKSAEPLDSRSWGHGLNPVLSENDKFLLLLPSDYKVLHKFELESRVWTTITLSGPWPPGDCFSTLTVCSSELYLFTGLDNTKTEVDSFWKLDINSEQPNAWQIVKTANRTVLPPGHFHGAVSNGRAVFIYGGVRQYDVWQYDPQADTWAEVLAAPGPLCCPDHIFLVDDILFVVGETQPSKPKLAALQGVTVVDKHRTHQWLAFRDCGQGLSESWGRYPFITSDKLRLFVFQDVNSAQEHNVSICVLDLRRLVGPQSNQSILSGAQQERLSIVRRDITAEQSELFTIPDRLIGCGGNCDVFFGTHKPSGLALALKRPRMSTFNLDDTIRRTEREVNMWSTFDHTNVLPFLGVLSRYPHIYLASPWMERGDLSTFSASRVVYLKDQEKGDVPWDAKHDLYHVFNEREVIQGIAAGIAYLHSRDFVHGDLKGKNILLGEDNVPLLCDFGMTKALDATSANTSMSMKGAGTVRWQSPELFMNESKTFKSDIYALAMVIVEVLTGLEPLSSITHTAFAYQIVDKGQRPSLEPRSRRCVDFMPLWSVAAGCWVEAPDNRPSIDETLKQLNTIPISEMELIFSVKQTVAAGKFFLIEVLGGSVAGGGFCDIYIGIHKPSGIKLALKRPRLPGIDTRDILRRIHREAEIWSAFDHANVLPFLGAMVTDTTTYLVSLWMERGDLSDFSSDRVNYLKRREKMDVPRDDLYDAFDERQAVRGIASGIAYLHSLGYVHGDLKGKNVLLGEGNIPLLHDFGLTKALESSFAETSMGLRGAGTWRWQSPELFKGGSKTFKSDVYAFAMTIVEVLTGAHPLPALLRNFIFLNHVVIGHERPLCEPPSRCGVDFSPLWSIAVSCWAAEPEDRPSIHEVLDQLQVILAFEEETG